MAERMSDLLLAEGPSKRARVDEGHVHSNVVGGEVIPSAFSSPHPIVQRIPTRVSMMEQASVTRQVIKDVMKETRAYLEQRLIDFAEQMVGLPYKEEREVVAVGEEEERVRNNHHHHHHVSIAPSPPCHHLPYLQQQDEELCALRAEKNALESRLRSSEQMVSSLRNRLWRAEQGLGAVREALEEHVEYLAGRPQLLASLKRSAMLALNEDGEMKQQQQQGGGGSVVVVNSIEKNKKKEDNNNNNGYLVDHTTNVEDVQTEGDDDDEDNVQNVAMDEGDDDIDAMLEVAVNEF